MHASVQVGDTSMNLVIQPAGGRHRQGLYGAMPPLADLPASTPLAIGLRPDHSGTCAESWFDDADGKLESKLGDVAAAIIVEGERSFRERLREMVRIAEERRRAAEAARLARIAELDRQRVEELRRSGELLRQAEEIRSLVERVSAAMATGQHALTADELDEWRRWALCHADEVDPVKSVQVLRPLRPPSTEAP